MDSLLTSGLRWIKLTLIAYVLLILPCVLCVAEPRDYIACVLNSNAVTTPVLYDDVVVDVASDVNCRDICFPRGYVYYLYIEYTKVCYCGTGSEASLSCQQQCPDLTIQPEPVNGSVWCNKRYVRYGRAVDAGITLSGLQTHTTYSSLKLTVNSSLSSAQELWHFSSGPWNLTTTSSLFTPVLPTPVLISLTLTEGEGTVAANVTLPVLDPTTLGPATLPEYIDLNDGLAGLVELWEGTEVEVRWTREDENGVVIPGKYCSRGWQALDGKCISSSEPGEELGFLEASEECSRRAGSLVSLADEQQRRDVGSLLSLRIPHIIGAVASGGNSYRWNGTAESAYFSAEAVTQHYNGDCVAMNSEALYGINCDDEFPFICQKDAEECPEGGSYVDGQCYVISASQLTWENAEAACNLLPRGHLVTPSSQNEQDNLWNLVFATVTPQRSDKYWLGLNDRDLEGHYFWVNSEPFEGTVVRVNGVTWEDCISTGEDGGQQVWTETRCDEALHYVCQYPSADEVTRIESHVTGIAVFPYLPEHTQPSTDIPQQSGSTFLYLFPELVFEDAGLMRQWHIALEANQLSEYHLQVFTPTCPRLYYLVPPGCDGNVFSECSLTPPMCQSRMTCPQFEHYCHLVSSCISLTEPCSCSVYPGSSPCQATSANMGARYTLAREDIMVIAISQERTMYRVSVPDTVDSYVKQYSILGIQFLQSKTDPCIIDHSSTWRQTAYKIPHPTWATESDNFYLEDDKKNRDTLCFTRATYTSPEVLGPPSNLASRLTMTPGNYTWSVTTDNALTSSTRSVFSVMETSILGMKLQLPAVLLKPISKTSVATIAVQRGVNVSFLVSIDQGTRASLIWDTSSQTSEFNSSCPYSLRNASCCINPPSYMQFGSLHKMFDFNDILTNIAITAYNHVSSKKKIYDIIVEEKISGLTLLRDLTHALPVIDYTYNFTSKLAKGSNVTYRWRIRDANGNIYSDLPNLSVVFPTSGMRKIRLTAFNNISSVSKSLRFMVYGQSEARGLGVISPSLAAAGQRYQASIEVYLNKHSSVRLAFIFGDGYEVDHVYKARSTGMATISVGHMYGTIGLFNLEVTLVDNLNSSTTLTTQKTIEVLEPVTEVLLTGPPSPSPSGVELVFTAIPQGGNGTLYYQWIIHGNQFSTVNNTFHYTFPPGNVSIVVTASNNASAAASNILNLTTEEPITGLDLIYLGPTLVGESAEIIASVLTGSHVMYKAEVETGVVSSSTAGSFLYDCSVSGRYNLSITASNGVSAVRDLIQVTVVNSLNVDILALHFPKCTSLGSHTYFTVNIVHIDISVLNCSWKIDGENVANDLGLFDLNYVFDTAGNHIVYFHVFDPLTKSSDEVTSTVCVEEPVEDAALNLPLPVYLLDTGSAVVEFLVSTLRGTNLKYEWITSESNNVTTSNSYDYLATSTGPHVMRVRVFNEVSMKEVSSTVWVGQTENDSFITTDSPWGLYIALGQPCRIQAVSRFKSASSTYRWTLNGNPISNQATFVYTPGNTGQVHIKVHITSSGQESFSELIVEVEQVIESVQLDTDTVTVDPTVSCVMYAMTQGPDNASFMWTPCLTCPDVQTSSAMYTRTYHAAGTYTASVKVFNNISVATDSITINVLALEESIDVLIEPLFGHNFVPSHQVIHFKSQKGKHAVISGVIWMIEEISVSNPTQYIYYSGSQFNHTFQNSEFLVVSAIAQTTFNEPLIKRYPIQVFQRIYSLNFDSNKELIRENQEATFIARWTGGQGSEVMLKWLTQDSHDFVEQAVNTTRFTHTFPKQGNHKVKLEASNYGGKVSVTKTIGVHSENGCTILVMSSTYPYVPQGDIVQYSAHCPSSYNPGNLEWKIYDAITRVAQGQDVQFEIGKIGEVSIELNVSDGSSTSTIETMVYVQAKPRGLSIAANSQYFIVGQEYEFSSLTANGSDLDYAWTVNRYSYGVSNSTSFKYTFTDHGIFRIGADVQNQVGSATASIWIAVEEEITGLSLVQCCQATYVTNKLVSITPKIEKGSGVQYQWTLFLDPPLQLTGDVFTYTFLEPGSFLLEVTAVNSVGNSTYQSSIVAEEEIVGLFLLCNATFNNIFVGYGVIFSASVLKGSSITYDLQIKIKTSNISLSDVVRERDEKNFRVVFMQAGTYEITVLASNSISTIQTSRLATVKELECHPPILKVVGNINRMGLMSRQINMEVEVTVCNRYFVIHKWAIYKNTCDDASKPPVALPEELNANTPMLFMPPRILQYGVYCVMFSSQYATTPAITTVTLTLQVLPSPLMAIISGGDERTLVYDQTTVIDGTTSYDPDLPKNADPMFNYTMTCTSLGTQEVAEHDTGCFPTVDSGVVTIGPDKLKPNNIYLIELTVRKYRRGSAKVSQRLIVRKEDVPKVSIDCLSCRENDFFYISKSVIIKLLGSCHNCDLITKYEWSVRRDDGQLIVLDESTTTTGNINANLVIRQNVLNDNHTYEFALNVTSHKHRNAFGYAKLILEPAYPPSNGICRLRPKFITEAVALKNLLTISCVGWKDNSNTNSALQYHVLVRDASSPDYSSNWYPVYTGTKEHTTFYLSPFETEEGEVIITVQVVDAWGSKTLALNRRIKVLSLLPEEDKSRLELLTLEVNDILPILKLQNTPWLLQQYIIILLLQINGEANSGIESRTIHADEGDRITREKLRTSILEVLNETVSITAMQDIQQMAFALHLITTFVEEVPQDEVMLNVVTALLAHIIETVAPLVSQGWMGDEFVPLYLLGTAGNLIEVIHMQLTSLINTNMPVSTINSAVKGKRVILETAIEIVDDILFLLLQTQVVDEAPYVFETQYLHSLGVRTAANNIVDEHMTGTNRIKFPPNLLSDLKEAEVFQILSSVLTNPFVWGIANGFRITSEVVSISFTHINGSEILVHDLPQDEEIEFTLQKGWDIDDEDEEIQTGIQTTEYQNNFISDNFTDVHGVIHSFVIQPYETLTTTVSSANHISASVGVILRIFARRIGYSAGNEVPIAFYVASGYVPNASKYEGKLIVDAQKETDDVDNVATLFMSVEQWISGEDYQITVVNEGNMESVNVTLQVAVVACKYYGHWKGEWAFDGCKTIFYEDGVTGCRCNHLTVFGAAVLLSPVAMNFSNGHSISVVVLSSLCVSVFLYALLLILTRYWDILDLRRVTLVPFCGGDGLHKYELTVVTGRRTGAGTTANVGIRLFGEYNNSSRCQLQKASGGQVFARNSWDVFMMATHKQLGPLWKIQMWHDNSGLSPDWYLSYVVVRDLTSGAKTFFINNSWFSVNHNSTDKDILAAAPEKLDRFWTRFQAESARCLSDHHTWLSVLDRPPHSRATRTQRLTTCLATLMLYMCSITLWHTSADRYTNISLLYDDFIAGMLVPIGLLPLPLTLMLLFSKTKVKPRVSDIPRPSSAQTVEMDALVDLGSRDGSASTYRAQRELIHLHHIDRESSSESLNAKSGQLHRSDPLRVVREESRDDLPGSYPEYTADDVTASTSADKHNRGPLHDRRNESVGWSYDSILGWPETLPHAWMDSRESTTLQNQSNKLTQPAIVSKSHEGEHKTSHHKNRGTSLRQNNPLSQSTDSLDQILDDIDSWSIEDVEFSPGKLKESLKSSTNNNTDQEVTYGKTDELTAENFMPRTEPSLDDILEELREDQENTAQNTNGFAKKDRKQSVVSSESNGRRHSVSWSAAVPSHSPVPRRKLRSMSTSSEASSRVPYCNSPTPTTSKESFQLPHWCIIIAYSASFTMAISSIITILVVGLSISSTGSMHWMLSVVTSLFMSACVVEPIKAVVMAVVNSIRVNTLDVNIFRYFQPLLEVSDKLKEMRVRPLGGYSLLQAREEGKKLSRLYSFIRSSVGYMFFFWLLVALNYTSYNGYQSFLLHRHVQHDFTKQESTRDVSFYDVKNKSQFWEWLTEVGAERIHAEQWDTESTHGHLVGLSRLVQTRSLSEPCPAADALKKFSASHLAEPNCFQQSGSIDRVMNSVACESNCNNSHWEYQSAQALNSVSFKGQLSEYSGGGFVQLMGANVQETKLILNLLKTQEWVDNRTRAVFLETTLYNVNLGVFIAVRLVFEFTTIGAIFPSLRVDSFQVLSTGSNHISAIAICQLFLVFVGIVQIYHLVKSVRRHRCAYFRSFRNLTHVISTVLTWCSNFIFIAILATDAATFVNLTKADDNGQHVSVLYNINLHNIWRMINGILIFLTTIMVACQLRFLRPISVFVRTLNRARYPILGTGFMFILLVIAQASLAEQWYGTSVYAMRTIIDAFVSFVVLLRGDIPFLREMALYNRALTTCILLWWLVVAFYGLIAIMVAILTNSLKTVKSQMNCHYSLEPKDNEMIEYFISQLKKWIGITKPKPASRRVQFEGLSSAPSSASVSGYSGRDGMRDGMYDAVSLGDGGTLVDVDEDRDQMNVDRLLERVVPTWNTMLDKLDEVAALDQEEQKLAWDLEKVATLMNPSLTSAKPEKPSKPPNNTHNQRPRTNSLGLPIPPPRKPRTLSASDATSIHTNRTGFSKSAFTPPARSASDDGERKRRGIEHGTSAPKSSKQVKKDST